MADFFLCDNCGKQIKADAFVCKHCGRRYKARNRGIVLLVSLLFLVLMGVGLKDEIIRGIDYLSFSLQSELSTLDNNTYVSNVDSWNTYLSDIPIGSKAIQNNVGITVLDVKEEKADSSRELKEDERLVAIYLEIDNTKNTKAVISSNLLSYKLYDNYGDRCKLDLLSISTSKLDDKIDAGKVVRGKLVYKVKDGRALETFLVKLNVFKDALRFNLI